MVKNNTFNIDKQKQGRRNYIKGLWAEYYAILLLYLKGYTIIARRFKHYYGEIDIIAKKNHCLIAIEVKYRAHQPIEHPITNQQLRYIKRALDDFFQKNHQRLRCNQARIDAIIIHKGWRINHLKDIT